MPGPVGRRAFLGRLGVALAGVAVAACAKEPPARPARPVPPVMLEPAPRALTEQMMREACDAIMRAQPTMEVPHWYVNERTARALGLLS